MKDKAIFLLVIVCLLTLTSAEILNSEPPGRLYITGLVYKSPNRQPVPSVLVILSRGDKAKGRSITGDDGRYYIGKLEEGQYDIVVKSREKVLFRGNIQLPKDRHYNIEIK